MTIVQVIWFYLLLSMTSLVVCPTATMASQRWSNGESYNLEIDDNGLATLKVTRSDLTDWIEYYLMNQTLILDAHPEYSWDMAKTPMSISCQVTMRRTVKKGNTIVMVEFTGRFPTELFIPCTFGPQAVERLSSTKTDVLQFVQTTFDRVDEKTMNVKRVWIEAWDRPHRFAMTALDDPDFVTKQIPPSEMVPPYERFRETTIVLQPEEKIKN